MTAHTRAADNSNQGETDSLNTAGVATFWKDIHGRFLSCNLAYQQFIGRSMEEIIGHTVEEIGAINSQYPPLIDDAAILSGKSISHVSGKLLDSTNQPREVVVSKSPLIIKGEIAGVVGTIEDITEQIAQSDVLLQLTEAIQYVPGGILVYQWNSPGDFRILMANPVAKRMFNIPDGTKEDLNDVLEHCLHPEDSWCAAHLTKKLQAGAKEASCKCRFYPVGSQEYIWVMIRVRPVPKASGSVILYIALTDVTKEQQNAQALIEAQHAYQEVAAGAGLVVWNYDMKKNIIEFLSNERTMERYAPPGIPRKVYGGSGFFEQFITPESLGPFRQLHENLRQGKAGSCEIKYLTKPGQPPHWAKIIYTLPTGTNKPDIAYGVGINITAEKLRTEKYNTQLQMLHTVIRSNLLAKSHFDLTENKLLDYIRHSPNALDIDVGCSYEYFYDLLLELILSKEDKWLVAKKLERNNLLHLCAQESNDFSMEYKRHCDDLSPIMVECTVSLFTNQNGHVECFICFYDITNKFINYIIADKLNELGYNNVALVNNLTGTMTFYSKKTGILENTPEQPLFYDDELLGMISKYISDAKEAEDLFQQMSLDTIVDFLDHHPMEDMFDFAFDFHDKYGRDTRKRLQACYLDSSRTSIFVIQSDITKQYREERAQLKRLEEALNVADRASASKSLFLAGISHDMRTPLNGILSFTDFALKTESRSQQNYYLTKIRQSGELLLALINDTLNLTRIESGKITVNPEWVDGRALIDGVIAGVSMSANERQLSLNVHIGSEMPRYLITDKLKLQEILLNIISNAIKFTKSGGSVDVELDIIPPQEQTPDELKAVQSIHHRWLRCIIRDTGIGISQQFIPHLFTAFSQEESKEIANPNGTGLGLAIVKKYVDMMGGSIQVRSKLHYGTAFELHLLVEETAAMPNIKIPPAEKCHFGHLHILLAEDNVLNQEIANMLLVSKGASVEIANNGQEAVKLFEASKPGTYQLILMDLRMPVMNGYDAAKLIRQSQHPDGAKIPIVAMTADAYDEDIKHCLAIGMNGHVCKPINPDKLYGEIAKWCSGV